MMNIIKFYAIFNQTADHDLPTEDPVIPAPTRRIPARIQKIDEQIAPLAQNAGDAHGRTWPLPRPNGNRAWQLAGAAVTQRPAQGNPDDPRHTGRQADQAPDRGTDASTFVRSRRS